MKKYLTLAEVREALFQKHLTLPDLLQHYLRVIEENEHLNAFNEVFFDSAILQANVVQHKLDAGVTGKLAGMVIGIKDNICYLGHHVSASSKMLENFVAPYSATVVRRLLDEDAIIIGRLNCDEFAMGGSNETSFFGPVRNFADQEKVSGGSSGGSAVAVQAGMCLATLGTDTGGSVRQPAAFTGIIGFKPSYGRISRYGVVAYASSFDQVGTFTQSVADAAILLEVLSGADEFDSTASRTHSPIIAKVRKNIERKKIGVLKQTMDSPTLDGEIKSAIETCIQKITALGHTVEQTSFEMLDFLVPTYYVLTSAEASSNLSRYDGVRYGHRSESEGSLTDLYINNRSEGFGEEVKRRIMLGTFVLSAGYYDAYYQKAQKIRRMIKDQLDQLFSRYDFLLLPVTSTPAFGFGEKMKDPLTMYMGDIYTVLANLAGVPAIALPLGNNSKGLPLSVQLISKQFDEAALLDFSNQLEKSGVIFP